MERRPGNGYSVAVSDAQVLQRLRRKIIRTGLLLNSCLDAARQLQRHCCRLDALNLVVSSHEILAAIENYTRAIELHRESFSAMLQILNGSADLVCVPPFRVGDAFTRLTRDI